MEWQGWFTLAIVALVLIGMLMEFAGPDLIMMAGLFTLAAAGILEPKETFAGFSNPSVMTIGALFVLSAALRNTGAMEATLGRLFGQSKTEQAGLIRICPPLAFLSAFLNNTTIVAMMTPVVIDWARRVQISPSRLLIPLAYATILGSVSTLIGTSVILTVAGLMQETSMQPMGFFELTPVGIPIAIAGLGYLFLIAPRLLPDRQEPSAEFGEHRREYTASMLVEAGGPLVGQSVETAGLRQLPGLFLIEIIRANTIITPVAPDEQLQPDDRLVFAGIVSTIVDLQRIRGLIPYTDTEDSPQIPGSRLIEAVISHSSPLVNRSIRDINFRTVYDGAVIAVHRNGGHVPGKIGEIVLRAGDTLLLQAGKGFTRAHQYSRDFYLASELPGSEAPRYDRAWVSIGVLLAMVLLVTSNTLPIAIASFLAAGALIATRCINGNMARRSVELSVLVVIGAGLGIASAMMKTGAAAWIADGLVSLVGSLGPTASLALIYLVTLALAETLNHNAAAAVMFPISVAAASQLGVEPRAFVMATAVAATCAFASPVAYQTHLIVYGPGGYRFRDFIRVGLPLNLICAGVALLLIPVFWKF